jgi:two-component system C4-dicarboxylate transport sensor histidine kinase DctB
MGYALTAAAEAVTGSRLRKTEMAWARLKQLCLLAGVVATITVFSVISQHVWRDRGLRALQAINEQRVELAAGAVKAEISRQDHLPFVLSLDPDVRAALARPHATEQLQQLSRKLGRINHEADTRALYVLGPDGTVLASSDWDAADTLVGRNLADRPYFLKAKQTGTSSYLGVEVGSDRARYYLAVAVTGPSLLGVAVVRIEFDALESAWEKAGERILVTDPAGTTFLASDPAYKYRMFQQAQRAVSSETPGLLHFPGPPLAPIDSEVVDRLRGGSIVQIRAADEQASYLYQSMGLPEFDWTIHRLNDLTSVNEDQRDGGIIGGAISALIIALMFYLFQRHRAYIAVRDAGTRLQSQVADRTRELRELNESLKNEVDERGRTEARLRTTQNELVQAGKLAALGQMSAAIAHEINQPLAAIRTFMASTKIFAQQGDRAQVVENLEFIDDLADRMARITGHLKTFARKSGPGHHPEPVLVDQAIDGTLFMLESQIKESGTSIEKDIPQPFWVMGHAVQLEQVILNLVRNAIDASADRKPPMICISVRASHDDVVIAIADNGSGFTAGKIGEIFDPFFTTKPVGKGLGLGLSISYGIVQDFGGEIRAANRPNGGAELTVTLPRYDGDPASGSPVHA